MKHTVPLHPGITAAVHNKVVQQNSSPQIGGDDSLDYDPDAITTTSAVEANKLSTER